MNDKWTQKRFMDVQDKDRWKVIDDIAHTPVSPEPVEKVRLLIREAIRPVA